MILLGPDKALAPNTVCFTTSSAGGVSSGSFSSLNLAMHVGDNPKDVEVNRHLLNKHIENIRASRLNNISSLNSESPIAESKYNNCIPYLEQIHSSKVITFEDENQPLPACDGIFSNATNQPLAILTADCLPIVLVSNQTNEFAAIHAGWRGLKAGIIDSAIKKFSTPVTRISAWIGPGICQRHFEVGEEVADQFSEFNAQISSGTQGKCHINLSGIAEVMLKRLGLVNVQCSDACTYCRNDLFSYRRSTHHGFSDCGRMATFVVRY